MNWYRNPNEYVALTISLFLVLVVVVVTATATVCTSLIFFGMAVVFAYGSSRTHHQALLAQAHPVNPQTQPDLHRVVEYCAQRVQPGPLQVFVTRSRDLNAYTFGLESPKVIVLYSSLFNVMDADELAFIIGHEMGHVALGHTWLNSLIGGLAGIPSPSMASAVLQLAFLNWNRACEISADRAGLIACRNPDKAVSALVKLVAGPAGLSPAALADAYRQIDAQDDTPMGAAGEIFASHPLLIRRINNLRQWAASPEYQRANGRGA